MAPSRPRPDSRLIAAVVCLVLIFVRNAGFWSYLLRVPGSWDVDSLAVVWSYALVPAGLTLAFVASCWGLGLRALGLSGLQGELGPLEDLCAWALGIGIAAYGMFGLGLLGALRPVGLGLLAAAAAVLGWPAAWRAWVSRRPSTPPEAGGLWRAIAAGGLAFAAWHAIVTGLAPATDWDVQALHLALPKIYWLAGRIMEIPWFLHSHWPHLIEVLNTAAVAVGRDGAAAVLHGGACAGLVAAVFLAGREELDVPSAWVSAVLLAAQPVVLRAAGVAHYDGFAALFYFLAAWTLWRWRRSEKTALLVLAGVLAGLSASSKLFGLISMVLLAVWIPWERRGRPGGVKSSCVFAVAALLVAAPWYVKTWVWTGNPVWPFFSGIFGGTGGAADLDGLLRRSNVWTRPLDWELVFRYGPQYLIAPLTVLAVWGARRLGPWPAFVRFLLIQALPAAAIFARYHDGWRYLLPYYPGLVLSAGWLAARAWKGRAGRWAAAGSLAFGVWPLASATQNNQLFAVLGARSTSEPGRDPRELYLERSLDQYRFYAAVDRLLGPGDKVLLFREIRGYYLDVPYQWGDPVNQRSIRYDEMSGPEDCARALEAQGITHVIVNRGLAMYGPGPGYYDERTLRLMDETLARYARPIARDGASTLYALRIGAGRAGGG